jgi:simple sugar transport system permease protein/ribose transport system permease protein
MKRLSRVLKSKEISTLFMIVIVSIIITIVNPVFLRIDNIIDLLRGNTVLGIMACGMLLVILTGGIDISIAAIIAASACIVGTLLISVTNNILLAVLVGVASGAVMGLINGMLIAQVNIPPIVSTLGMLSIINGIVKFATNGTWITNIPQNFIDFGQFYLFETKVEGITSKIGIPVQVLILIGIALITWLILKYTMFGRSVYAFGGSENAAQRIGYNTKNTQVLVYTYMGAVCGIAAFVHTSIFRQVDPNTFAGYEIQVIAAVVIGGTAVSGGYGSILGALLGVAFMSILNNGLILMRIPTFWHQIVIGIIIIVAVSMDAINKVRLEKKRVIVDIDETDERGAVK